MTDNAGKPPEKVDPETLVLRAKPHDIVRIKRNLLIGLVAVGCLGLVGLTWLGLGQSSIHPVVAPADEKDPEKHKAGLPDQVNALPKTYADMPVLGQPLPGDLGRPLLEGQRAQAARKGEGSSGHAGSSDTRAADVFYTVAAVGVGTQLNASTEKAQPSATGLELLTPIANTVAVDDQNQQAQKLAFMSAGASGNTLNPHTIQSVPSPYALMAGTVISASLVTGLKSDLPGMVIAQVSQNVFDTVTGTVLLVPQGTRLIGAYDSVVAFGQSRALLVWQRLIFPDGTSLQIDNLPATDASGYAGLSDGVDFHTWSLVKGVGLSTLLGVTAMGGSSDDSDLVRALRQSTQQTANQAGQKIVDKTLNVQPTLTVRPGWPLRVIVHKDIILQPYDGEMSSWAN